MKKIVLYLVLFGLICLNDATADEIVNISGQVIEAETGEPLPFAHVFISDVGTVSNKEGFFNMAVDESLLNYDLKVSFIGYNSARVSLAGTEDYSSLRVELQPVNYELEGVYVRSGISIMSNVLNRIDFNYEYSHQSALCYFREKLSSQLNTQYIAEGVLDIYLPNNYSTNDIQISDVKSRRKSFTSEEEADFTLIKGHASDMIQSIVWRKNSFLNDKYRKHYEFTYDGVTQYNGKEVLIVKFWPVTRKGKFHGTMFVDITSYAIIKVDYIPDTSKNRFWDSVRWTEEFDYRDGRWFLSRVSYEGEWFENDEKYSFESMLVVNVVSTVDNVPAMGLLMSKNDVYYEEVKDEMFTEEFWKGFSFVKMDESEISEF